MKFADLRLHQGGLSRGGRQSGDGPARVALAIRAAVMSPNFLFRMEAQCAGRRHGPIFALNDYQLASRLSYFLWSSMPDDALLCASQGRHAEAEPGRPGGAHAERSQGHLADQGFSGPVAGNPRLGQHPQCRPGAVGLDADRDRDLLQLYRPATTGPSPICWRRTTPSSTRQLAKLYGISGVTGPEFRKVSVDPSSVAASSPRPRS